MVSYTSADAIGESKFERMVEATYSFDDYWSLQTRFVLFVAGRLGMRAGEIAHMKEEWIDWRRQMISIPHYEECTNGRDNSICGYCKQNAEQMARVRGNGAEPSDFEDEQWSPKTDAAAREIPFDASARTSIVVEEYFDRFDEYTNSRASVNRRVTKVAEKCQCVRADGVYPHALRATAANYWVDRGIDQFALKSMMGWADLQTAHKYVSDSGERVARALRDIPS